MVVFPNGKINLGLYITGKRNDGYHNLETVFYPVPCRDVLEIIRSNQFEFTSTGLPITGNPHHNLCVKAYHLLKTQFPQLPPVHIHLHKAIPMGAGLGGGSADGAFTLALLNTQFNLGLPQQQLIDLALQLGSDCPFFIVNTPAIGKGRGELLEPLEVDLSAYHLVVVNPGIHVSTAGAFAQITPQPAPLMLRQVMQQPVETWRTILNNDFEPPVFARHPEIQQLKETLYQAGAVYACMSGSGSTVFGLFGGAAVPAFSFPPHYKVYSFSPAGG